MFDSSKRSAADLARLVADVRALCTNIDPSTLAASEVAPLVDACTAIRQLADGALTRLADAYDRSGRWRDRGAESAADDLARRTGTAPSAEKRRVDASKKLAERPRLDDAVRTGKLSADQTSTIADSAADPDTEAELIDAARTDTHRSFRKKALSARAAADPDAAARRKRIHDNRSCRTWIADDGTGHLHLQDLPERIAEITAALKPTTDAFFEHARRQGRRDHPDAYRADALHDVVCGGRPAPAQPAESTQPPQPTKTAESTEPSTSARTAAGTRTVGSTEREEPTEQPGSTGTAAGTGTVDATDRPETTGTASPAGAASPASLGVPAKPPPPRRGPQAVRPDRKVIAIVDLAALQRGTLEDGETCEIAGIGPVPVAAARAILGDGLLTIVLRDGVDIRNITHAGRQVTAHQRTALEARGCTCEIIGCGATHNLEIDHTDPWMLTRHTTIDELAWLCLHHHDLKTRNNLRLTGPPGHRTLVPADTNPPTTATNPTQHDLFTTAT